MDVTQITVQLTNSKQMSFKGRSAWALKQLIDAGEKGCTPITRPAPRWSSYIHDLRNAGVDVETIWQVHKGAYAGAHGRYILKTPMIIVSEVLHGE